MDNRYVVDTCALISTFSEIFNEKPSISSKSMEIISNAFYDKSIKLIFPSTVFIELYKKWFNSSEMSRKIKYEIFNRIKFSENMEIQVLDKEILENFILVTNIEKGYNFDNHDKQIYASAMTMDCPLITSDLKIIRYNKKNKYLKSILN